MSTTLDSRSGHEAVSNTDQSPSTDTVRRVVEKPHGGSGEMELTPERAKHLPAALRAPDTSALRDVAEATFGVPHPGRHSSVDTTESDSRFLSESVLGSTDERVQIGDTTALPWRMNASLRITAADNSLWVGTGWFIGPHTLVTAGHCVFIHAPGTSRHGWAQSIQVMPGRNGAVLPFGSITSTELRAVNGWTGSPDQNFDYGAIILPVELGNAVGGFGFGVFTDSELLSSTVTVAGYPGDKPAGTQWFDTRKIASVGPSKVFYELDTVGGQSGSAVYCVEGDEFIAVGVHAYGGTTTNSGTRITQQVYDNLMLWKA
jgi:V8-like Glu-specific endopeptidase